MESMTRVLSYLSLIVLFAGFAFGDGILKVVNDGYGGPLTTTSLYLLGTDGTYEPLAVIANASGTVSTQPVTAGTAGTFTFDGSTLTLTAQGQNPVSVAMHAVSTYESVGSVSTGPTSYDLNLREPGAGAGNVSNLNSVAAGGTTTTGFVIVGTTPRWVMIRAVGPSLAQFGLSSFVANPSLTVYNGRGTPVTWSGYPSSTIGSWSNLPNLTAGVSALAAVTGAFPLTAGSSDCVAYGQLQPGAYTVVSSAPAGQAGSLMTEVYVLPY